MEFHRESLPVVFLEFYRYSITGILAVLFLQFHQSLPVIFLQFYQKSTSNFPGILPGIITSTITGILLVVHYK